jgi:hypothetical protein
MMAYRSASVLGRRCENDTAGISTAQTWAATQGDLSNYTNLFVEPPDHAIGRSRGDLTTKIRALCDVTCVHWFSFWGPGQGGDLPMFPQVMGSLRIPGPGKSRSTPEFSPAAFHGVTRAAECRVSTRLRKVSTRLRSDIHVVSQDIVNYQARWSLSRAGRGSNVDWNKTALSCCEFEEENLGMSRFSARKSVSRHDRVPYFRTIGQAAPRSTPLTPRRSRCADPSSDGYPHTARKKRRKRYHDGAIHGRARRIRRSHEGTIG